MKFKASRTVSLEQRIRKLETQQIALIEIVADMQSRICVLRSMRLDDIRAFDDSVSALDYAVSQVENRVEDIYGEEVVGETTVNPTRDNDWYLGFARLFSNRKTNRYMEGLRKW